MHLSAVTYQQVIRSLRSDSASGRDQRGEPRVGLRARARIIPQVVDDKGSQPLEVGVRDLSVNGIGLTSARPLPKGSLFLLRLAQPDNTWLEVAYRIAYTNTTSGGLYVIGAVRQTPLPKHERVAARSRVGPGEAVTTAAPATAPAA